MLNIRNSVLNSLISAEANGRYINLESDAFLKRTVLSPRDRAFYTALLYGVTERRVTLDYQIGALTSSQVSKLDMKVRILLEMGLYQILYMDSVPNHAAVGETVAVAKKLVNPGALGLINAVLRAACTELFSDGKPCLRLPDKNKDEASYLSVLHGFPRRLCRLWLRAYGSEKAADIMEALNRTPKLSIRVNTLKISRDLYLEKLKENGFDAEPSRLCDDGILLANGAVTSLPGYTEGLFFVQDDASRIAVSALGARPGENILDCCACPGGKSFAMALDMGNFGSITSADIHENKLSLISSGAARLRIDIITPMQADASAFHPEFEEKFDRVLCDVPCSGFGTIAKKPDLRFKDLDAVSSLPELQYSIISNCARYVKSGGYLMYSTCTLNPAENEENAKRFLASHTEFEKIEMHTIFPTSKNDGFFYLLSLKRDTVTFQKKVFPKPLDF